MLCSQCKYEKMMGVMSGQGFTEWTCKGCGKKFWNANTDIPMYCKECAEKINVCEQCGVSLSID